VVDILAGDTLLVPLPLDVGATAPKYKPPPVACSAGTTATPCRLSLSAALALSDGSVGVLGYA